MAYLEEANLLVRQFENKPRRSWEKTDDSSRRVKFVEDCIRLVGVWERSKSGWKRVSGLEDALSAFRNGEEMLFVTNVNSDDVKMIAEELKTNTRLLGLRFGVNQIGPEGARHLSDMLRENCTLLFLSLYDCRIGPEGARHLSDALRENCTLLYLDIRNNQIGPEGARHLSEALRENCTLLHLDIRDNNIRDKDLESQIYNEIKSRQSSSFPSRKLSFEECRLFLQSNFSVQSWISVRQDTSWHRNFDQLPPEMWGEILGFLTNDSSSLHESILVFDLRSGFYFPYPICNFSPQETPLLSMIPCIEGLFRQYQWTRERLYRARLCIPSSFFQEEMRRHWNIEESSERDSDSDSSPPLKRTKIT